MKKITFLHTADLHLDSPMLGLSQLPERIYKRLLTSTFKALRTLVDVAIEKQVDFIIIAGDVYDGEDRSIRGQIRFRHEMERLAQKGIKVYLTHGNHDHLSGNWTHIPLPENVVIFGEEVEVKIFKNQSQLVHLYGFSYSKRHVYERKIDDYIKMEGADFHIGILHGNDGGDHKHGNYAPFQVKELIQKQFDYWALGHIHKSKLIQESPPILYPGNIQGRHHKEQGPKGCYLVILTGNDSQLEWVNTADVEWGMIEIDVSGCSTFQQVFQICLNSINQIRHQQPIGKIVKLILEGHENVEVIEGFNLDELLDILHESEMEEDNFVWVSDIRFKDGVIFDRERLKVEDGFYRELLETIENFHDIQGTMEPLFIHPIARKHLSSINPEEQEILIKEAEKILVQLLYGN